MNELSRVAWFNADPILGFNSGPANHFYVKERTKSPSFACLFMRLVSTGQANTISGSYTLNLHLYLHEESLLKRVQQGSLTIDRYLLLKQIISGNETCFTVSNKIWVLNWYMYLYQIYGI